jgi:hypothetical protein
MRRLAAACGGIAAACCSVRKQTRASARGLTLRFITMTFPLWRHNTDTVAAALSLSL